MSFQNDGQMSSPHPHVVSSSSRIRLNQDPTLFSISASRSRVATLQNEAVGKDSSSSLKDYTKDQHVTSKPPLPTSVQHRPPTRPQMVQAQQRQVGQAWSTSTTPRMRVPLAESFPPPPHPPPSNGHYHRPVSPLTRGFCSSAPLETLTLPAALRASQDFGNTISDAVSNFLYDGPHQVYGGPVPTNNTLHWPDKRTQEPPPPPSAVMRDIQFQHRPPPPPPVSTGVGPSPVQSSPEKRNADTEAEFLVKILQAARQTGADSPFQSHRNSALLTSAGSSTFPSSHTLAQMEQTMRGHQQVATGPSTNSVGPFNTGIPSEIQDDLLRLEMLLEFRKYKDALNQKIQNQNQVLQSLHNSGQNSQQQLPAQPHIQYIYQPNPALQQPLQQQPSSSQWHTLANLMDSPLHFGVRGGSRSPAGGTNKASGAATPEENPVWTDDVAEPFIVNTFIEPNIITPPATTAGQRERSLENQSSVYRPRSNTGARADSNANDTKSISTLQTRNFEEFAAMVEQSRTGFPSGIIHQQQNPLLAGAQQFNAAPPSQYQFAPRATPAEVVRAAPLRIQVAPKEASSGAQSPSVPPQQVPQYEGSINSVQQQYQKFLLDRNFQSLSPNSFKQLQMEQAINDDVLMMRKPVAVSFTPKSPKSSPQPTSTIALQEKPSPFFPGFSKSSLQMKLKTPDELKPLSRKESNNGQHPMEGVQELGNLLSQLPVLSRKQKVEEFHHMVSTLKPATPVTEVESETSMIPMVSSNGTLDTSERRPDAGTNSKMNMADAEEELKNLDTNKLSINELVTLGRKIYRILSQLSNTETNPATTPPTTQQIITTPMTLQMPLPSTPVFTSSSNKGLLQSSSHQSATPGLTSPQLVVDFNSIPNPSFITGPGLSKSLPKIHGGGRRRSRTPSQPPNLFRKVLHPPPTRWNNGDESSVKSRSNPPPSASMRLQDIGTSPRNSKTQQEKPASKKRQARVRRSMTSLMSGVSTSALHAEPGTKSETKAFVKRKNVPVQFVEPRNPTAGRVIIHNPDPLPDSFPVREKYNNQHSPKNLSKFRQHRRQGTPFPFIGDYPRNAQPNTPGRAPTRGASVVRRNFIMENISKIANMKKTPDSRVRPRQLPPVNKKKYENVPSTIPGSRSRSNSIQRRDESQSEMHQRYHRSSSLPITASYSPGRHYPPQRSVSTPRPSTGMSVHVPSSRSSSQVRPSSRTRPASQGTLNGRTNNEPKRTKSKASQMPLPTKGSGSKVKFGKLPSKTSVGNGDSVRGSNSALARKSRSKTKRASLLQKKNSQTRNKNSSVSSVEEEPPSPKPSKVKKAVKPKVSKVKLEKGNGGGGGRKQQRKPVVAFGEMQSTDDEREKEEEEQQAVFNTASEQRMIREMVKAEMNLMVKEHVKSVLLDKKRSPQSSSSRSRSRSRSKEDQRQRREPDPEEHTLRRQQEKHDFDEEVDEGGDPQEGKLSARVDGPPEEPVDDEEEDDDAEDMESGNLTPVYTPPSYFDEALFSLEKWINPEGNSAPGSAYTSAKETPLTTANSMSYGMVGGIRRQTKPQTVRFSLPGSNTKSKGN